jgi:hypothetical protein
VPLAASCPRCTSPVTGEGESFACTVHGRTAPLWRPDQSDYETFAELVARVDDLPVYLPWPMSPGWSIADFGCVGDADRVRATVTATAGRSDLDGQVEVTIVSEDPGVGLGARCAGTTYDDPGPQLSSGQPSIHVRAGGRTVPMWLVDDSRLEGHPPGDEDDVLARAVFAGEADGRWLWLVMKPASAALLLHDDWLLADVTGFGPEALEIPFGGPRPSW